MSEDLYLLLVLFLFFGNVNLEIGKFKLTFKGMIFKIISAFF